MNVLIIDDDPDDTALFCRALYELFPDATCIATHSLLGISKTLNDLHPDIIFMDGHMYPLSGEECIKQLSQLIDRDQTKLIIHTGSLSPSEVTTFQALGVDDILIKPYSYVTLRSNIMNILAKYNLASYL